MGLPPARDHRETTPQRCCGPRIETRRNLFFFSDERAGELLTNFSLFHPFILPRNLTRPFHVPPPQTPPSFIVSTHFPRFSKPFRHERFRKLERIFKQPSPMDPIASLRIFATTPGKIPSVSRLARWLERCLPRHERFVRPIHESNAVYPTKTVSTTFPRTDAL